MQPRAGIQERVLALARCLAAAPAAVPLLPALLPLAASQADPVETTLVIAFLILSLALHEVAHGWVALQCGDPTARDLGRLSLNPLVHVDPIWTVIVPALTYLTGGFLFGGAKPVPVDFRRLRHPLRDMSLVAVAGPLTNLLLAFLFLGALKLALDFGAYERDQLLPRVLEGSALFNVVLFVFNLVPIPPLDGSRILTWLLPPGLREPYAGLERFGMILIIALMFFVTPFRQVFWGGVQSTFFTLSDLVGMRW